MRTTSAWAEQWDSTQLSRGPWVIAARRRWFRRRLSACYATTWPAASPKRTFAHGSAATPTTNSAPNLLARLWRRWNVTCPQAACPTERRIEEKSMSLLPIFLKLDGRPCLLVGAGNVALDKIGSLLKTGLKLRVVAPEARTEIQQLALDGKLEWVQRPFDPADLDGNFLVITATDSAEVNRAIYEGALERNILCNSVDDIPNCDFFFGSVVNRGDLQIAISTAGESPAFAQRLRREIDEQLPDDLGPWLENLGRLRREVLAVHPRGEPRRLLLHRLAQLPVCESACCPSRRLALAPLAEENSASAGMVYLVGAGPGDPELLTVKALRLIQIGIGLLPLAPAGSGSAGGRKFRLGGNGLPGGSRSRRPRTAHRQGIAPDPDRNRPAAPRAGWLWLRWRKKIPPRREWFTWWEPVPETPNCSPSRHCA